MLFAVIILIALILLVAWDVLLDDVLSGAEAAPLPKPVPPAAVVIPVARSIRRLSLRLVATTPVLS